MLSNQRIVLITGASSGFGMLTSLRFAANGYHVIATMRDLRKSDDLLNRARTLRIDNRITCWKLDVNDENEVASIVKNIEKEFGRIDILVNNAGFAIGGIAEEVPLDVWREQFETNFFAVVRLTQAILPIMRKQRSGMIFNISSVSGRVGLPGYGPYSASKHALEGFSESLRLEVQSFGIRVVLIEPGAYKTSIWNKGFERILDVPASPYRQLMLNVLKVSRQTAETAPDPEVVASKIVAISSLKKPKLRYAMGKGATISLIGKALLPWNGYEKIVMKMLSKTSSKSSAED